MNSKTVTISAEQVEKEFLPYVRRPSRYIGGEINQIKKQLDRCDLTVALCFPDIYEVAMSYAGLMIIYDILNKIDGVAAERCFAPWVDGEKILRDKAIALFSLESKAALKNFDIIAFSLTNELCYTNVLNMLDLGGVNIRSKGRDESDPLVIAGGGISNCCEPMAQFIDLFVLGEGEEVVVELIELVRAKKKAAAVKKEILLAAAKTFEWAYVPSLYTCESQNNTSGKPAAVLPDLRTKFSNAIVKDFENCAVPLRPIVPFAQAVHERVTVEIMRGCPGRCRFCQASFCRRPVRFRSVEKIVHTAKACYESTGFDTVGLLSLSTADYPDLERLVRQLQGYFQDKHVGLSVPSLRVDKQLKLLPELVTSVRKSGLTIAVEAASEKVRQIINKPLNDKDLFAGVEAAYRAGWRQLKLYFMAGLPGETDDDIKRIAQLSFELAVLGKTVTGRTGQINISVSWFVPKPHTPFGFLGQKPKSYFQQAKELILDEKKRLRANCLHFKFHNIDTSVLESAIGRGNRRICDVIEQAWRSGARFDLWDECFDYRLWQEAFAKFAISIEDCAQKQFGPDEVLPWEHLGGPDKKYLLEHLQEATGKIEN